ncbi:MAG: LysR family transcriptional regulator [Peptococcaceae bacterium]|nr:LysR family transcriptional regulator [Peptococcaceae bacterium]
MQLNQLQFLLALSKEGSYLKTAKRLNVSQSTISMAIKNLEDELNYQIVKRSNKGISFTEKGQQVLEIAALIDMDIRELLNLKNTFLDEMSGKVFIAGASHGYNLQLVDLIIQLQKQYSRLQICLEDRNNLEIIREVAQGNYLMGLLQLNSVDEEFYQDELKKNNLVFSTVTQGDMCFAIGPNHPLYHRDAVCLEEFLQHSILASRYQVSEIFLSFFQKHGYKERIAILHDIYTSRHLVEKSNYYTTFLPRFGLHSDNKNYQQNLKEVYISDFKWTYKSGWVYRKDNYSVREKKIIQLIQQTWMNLQGVESER